MSASISPRASINVFDIWSINPSSKYSLRCNGEAFCQTDDSSTNLQDLEATGHDSPTISNGLAFAPKDLSQKSCPNDGACLAPKSAVPASRHWRVARSNAVAARQAAAGQARHRRGCHCRRQKSEVSSVALRRLLSAFLQ